MFYFSDIDRDGMVWRHILNFFRSLVMECETASSTTLEIIPSNERKAVAVEARWLGLTTLGGLLENLPDFSRNDIQVLVERNYSDLFAI